MKEIMAVIRMNKIGRTKKALVNAGFCAFTAYKVMGRGKGFIFGKEMPFFIAIPLNCYLERPGN